MLQASVAQYHGSVLRLGTAHQGIHKNLSVELKSEEGTKIVVHVEIDDNGVLYPAIDNKTEPLLSDEKLPVVINALWDARDEIEVEAAFVVHSHPFNQAQKVITQTFPGDLARQVALYFVFALNNLVLKSARNQIMFTDV